MSGNGRLYYVLRLTSRAVNNVPGTTTGAPFTGMSFAWPGPSSDVCRVTASLAGSLVDVVGGDI